MAVINQEVFCGIMEEPHTARQEALLGQVRHILNPYSLGDGIVLPVNREAAIQLLEQIRRTVAARGRLGSKVLRPHSFDSFDYLDRSQPWWGFEFETGWQNGDVLRQAIHSAWDMGINGVTFDGEGEGSYPCEITFAPSTMEDVVSGEAPACQFIQYMQDHRDDIAYTGSNNIGTHINISFPTLVSPWLTHILNNSLALLPTVVNVSEGFECVGDIDVRKELFGRSSLYGGFFHRNSEEGGSWVEGKLFRTTYSVDQFRKYVRICEALTCIGQKVQGDRSLQDRYLGVNNLWEMYLDPSVEPVFVRDTTWYGSPSRSWIDGTILAQCGTGITSSVAADDFADSPY